MPWLALLSADPSPTDNVLGPAVSTIAGYGLVGVALLVLGWLYSRGWRLVSPAREKEIREEARADLLTQIAQLIAAAGRGEQEKHDIRQQLDEQMRFAQSNLVPLLVNFTNATSALIPLLQELVRYREDNSDGRRHR